MDAELLSDRIATVEKAVIRLDERVDSADLTERVDDHTEAHIAHDERLTALEETLAGCIAHLERLQTQISTTETAIAEAEARVAEAEATEAVAEAIEAVVEAQTETEEVDGMAVEEIPSEPESEAAPEKPKSPNWLERLLAGQ